MGKEIYKRNILYAFAKAIMENDHDVLWKEFNNIGDHRLHLDNELEIKKDGINIRTGKPYKPSTIKECQRRLNYCERLQEDIECLMRLFNESSKKRRITKRHKSKGKVVQLTAYQRKEA